MDYEMDFFYVCDGRIKHNNLYAVNKGFWCFECGKSDEWNDIKLITAGFIKLWVFKLIYWVILLNMALAMKNKKY